jgi:tetratricopeptide (TPR) repeat protein
MSVKDILVIFLWLMPLSSSAVEKVNFNKGLEYYKNGHYEKAKESFKRSNEIEDDPEALLMISSSYKKIKDYGSCIKYANMVMSSISDQESRIYLEAKKLIGIGCNVIGYEKESIKIFTGFSYSEEDDLSTDVNLLAAESPVVVPKSENSVPITLEVLAKKITRQSMSLDQILKSSLEEIEDTSNIPAKRR